MQSQPYSAAAADGKEAEVKRRRGFPALAGDTTIIRTVWTNIPIFIQKGGKKMEEVRERFMREALALAREAGQAGEVPVGCVIVREGRIVGRGRNRREEKRSALSHAETEAIAQANEALGSWRLEDCELYVTLEPCPMCAGAILNARIPRVWYGARDRAFGACGGVMNLFMEAFPHPPALTGGVLEAECQEVLRRFFADLRENG